VDCNADVIVVSEDCHRISVLSWADGSVLTQFGSEGSGPGLLKYPRGVRVLADGSGLVVTDCWNNRLCVFTLTGALLRVMGCKEQGLNSPFDVLQCDSGGSFVVANFYAHNLLIVSHEGVTSGVYGKEGCGDGEFNWPSALAALPDGGLIVREDDGRRFQVFAALKSGPARE
jgi:tripartite motif-containing protein 71